MKLLVLDMDGVVNSNELISKWCDEKEAELLTTIPDRKLREQEVAKQYREHFKHSTELVMPELAARVARICKETECKILWSSSWRVLPMYRRMANTRAMFNRRGLPGNAIVGYTHDTRGLLPRGDEIREWIVNFNLQHEEDPITRAAVVDDLDEAGEHLPDVCKFFQTTVQQGLTEEITNNIIAYLKEEA